MIPEKLQFCCPARWRARPHSSSGRCRSLGLQASTLPRSHPPTASGSCFPTLAHKGVRARVRLEVRLLIRALELRPVPGAKDNVPAWAWPHVHGSKSGCWSGRSSHTRRALDSRCPSPHS